MSMCHDVDMSHHCLPGGELVFKEVIPQPFEGAEVFADMVFPDGTKTEVNLSYRRQNPTYYQQVHVWNEEKNCWDEFGYDYNQKTSNHKHKAFYASEVYDVSFVDQWLYFYDLVKGNVKNDEL